MSKEEKWWENPNFISEMGKESVDKQLNFLLMGQAVMNAKLEKLEELVHGLNIDVCNLEERIGE